MTMDKNIIKNELDVSVISGDLERASSSSKDTSLDKNDGVWIPDGGAKAWINLIGAFAGLTGAMGSINSNGALQEYITQNIFPNYSQSTLGWMFSLFSFTCFGLVLFVGPLFESFGSRVCMTIGISLFTLGYMSLSGSTKLYQFLLCNIIAGLGLSFVFGSSVGIIGHYFRKRRAFCLGIGFSGGALGGIVFPIVMRSLLPKVGFGWTIRVLGFIMITLFLIDLALTKDRRKETNPNSGDDSFYQKTIGRIRFGAFKEKIFSALVFSLMCNSFAFVVTLIYIVSYSVAAGYSYNVSTNLTIIMNATSILGRCFGGFLADTYGRFNVLLLISTMSTLCFLILWIPDPVSHTYVGLVIFSALYGISLGSCIPIGPSAVGQISKTSEFTSRYGTSSVVVSLLNLAGVPAGGAIIDTVGGIKGYDNLVIFITCISFLGWVGAFFARYFLVGFKWQKV